MRTDQPIRVMVIHRDRFATAGLVESLSRCSDFNVVNAVGEPDSAQHHDRAAGAQVVIADLAGALELAHRGVGGGGGRGWPAVVVASAPDRERELRHALDIGVRGYLVAGFSIEELVDCVRAVHRASRYLCPRAAARLAESTCFSPLTHREEAVLELVAQGLCNKSIARQLGIALGTVKSHLKSAYGKLLVGSRTEAVVVSERRGLLARLSDPQAHHVRAGDPGSSRWLQALH